MLNEDKILDVARYQEGDMDPQERVEFETMLQEDQQLRSLLADYNEIHQSLKIKIAPNSEDIKLRNKLSELNKQYFKSSSILPIDEEDLKPDLSLNEAKVISIRSYLKWMSVAAVLVIGLFVWAPWSTNLYSQYSFSKQMSVAERGVEKQSQIVKASELYNDGDYAGARNILQKEYMMTPQNPMLAYYFSITLIETGQEYEARTVLVNLYNGKSVFKYDAAFYIALSFVKEDDKANALDWLAKIPKENGNYHKAQSLAKEFSKGKN